MDSAPTHVAQLTPTGRGAIATLLLTGRRAVDIANDFFLPASGSPLADVPLGKIVFGNWQTRAEHTGEELVICRTSEHEIEIHCHGGHAAIEAIRQSLMATGCLSTTWQDVARAKCEGAIAAEARIALATATTERTAAILLDQLHGALENTLRTIVNDLADGQVDAARAFLAVLGERGATFGKHLTSPYRVVLAGPPNVGKSSLINALLGHARAIVFDQPGTTRDVLTGLTALDGWPVELSDTAGIRDTNDAIEHQGVYAARCHLQKADLVVLVCDAHAPDAKEVAKLVREFPAAMVIDNKCDLLSANEREASTRLQVSALTGDGLTELMDNIVQRLVPSALAPGDAVPFTTTHLEGIEAALSAVESGDLGGASETILRIGEPDAT